MKKLEAALAGFCALLVVEAGAAETLVVDAAGRTGDGHARVPFRTISEAVEHLRAGDRLQIVPGVYRESVEFKGSGRSDAPILIEKMPCVDRIRAEVRQLRNPDLAFLEQGQRYSF